jgi:V/A-type H+-transporting ATPase subunit E
MSLEAIVNRILRDARQRAAQIEEESRAEIRSIQSQCKETVSTLQEASRKRAEKLAGEQRERMVSMAQLDMRKEVLALKQDIIEMAFEKAISQLLEGDEENYSDLLKTLVLNADPEGDEELILNQKDRERMHDGFIRVLNQTLVKGGKKGKLKLSPESRPIKGGVILRRDRKEFNCSVESIIYAKRDELDVTVARILFPDVKKGE